MLSCTTPNSSRSRGRSTDDMYSLHHPMIDSYISSMELEWPRHTAPSHPFCRLPKRVDTGESDDDISMTTNDPRRLLEIEVGWGAMTSETTDSKEKRRVKDAAAADS